MSKKKKSRQRGHRSAKTAVSQSHEASTLTSAEWPQAEQKPALHPLRLTLPRGVWTPNDKIQFGIAVLAALAFGVNGLLWYSQQENFQAQQRAWLGATAAEVADVEAGKKPVVSVRVTNSGQTPAVNSEIILTVRLLSADRNCAPNWSDPRITTAKTSSSVIFPDDGVNLVAEHQEMLTQDRIQQLDAGGVHLCVNLIARYKDSFGDVHETQLCGFAHRHPKTEKHTIAALSRDCNRAD